MLERQIGLLGNHHAGTMAQAAQQLAGLGQEVLELGRSALAVDLLFDRLAFLGVDRPDFQHGIDKEAQALLGGQASRRSMGRRDQAEIFEIGHDIAHRRR